jgi:hypothetical protein
MKALQYCSKGQMIFYILFFLLTLNLYAQQIDYAREVIERLCAPDLHGRGYVAEGDKKAAEYIASQFSNFGLSAYQEGYFQKFTIPVNTYPGDLEVVLDDKVLIAGKDYLVNPCSPSSKGTFGVFELTKNDLLNKEYLKRSLQKAKGKFLLINRFLFKEEPKDIIQRLNEVINSLKYGEGFSVLGILEITDEKLTWHASTEVCIIPSFTIYKAETPEKIKKVSFKVDNKHFQKYNTQNVIGFIKGKINPNSIIVITAHYDHLGRMGLHTYFPGANDNASGTALLLDLARHYSLPENEPPFTIVFIAFGAEEIGLLGSKYYVENPLFPLQDIKFLVNLDIAGTGDEGITVVNGKVYEEEFNLLSKINTELDLLPQVKIRGEACNSDHCMFHLNEVPSFFIYTLGGIKAYHDVYDIPETLPLTSYEPFFQLLTQFLKEL